MDYNKWGKGLFSFMITAAICTPLVKVLIRDFEKDGVVQGVWNIILLLVSAVLLTFVIYKIICLIESLYQTLREYEKMREEVLNLKSRVKYLEERIMDDNRKR